MVDTIELRTLGTVVKTTYEDNPNTNAYTDDEKAKLEGIEEEATKNSSDSELLDRGNHVGVQNMSTIVGLLDSLDEKVDVVAGKELSDNNFTEEEKTKLAGLEGPHFKGTYTSLVALETAGIDAVAGDYADVDGGAGEDTFRCIWDVTNEQWVPQLGESTEVTGAQVKSLYESQPDTNAFTDTEKSKLAGIAVEATKNSSDSALLSRANHTGTQAISTVSGLQTALDGKINADGSRVLSDNNYTTAEKNKLADITALTGSTNFTWRFKGAWNPNTNNPNLQNGTGTPGDFFSVSANGTRSFGNQTFNFIEGDLVLYSGGVWRRISVNPVNYKPRGTISPPIPALRAVPTGQLSLSNGFYTVINTWNTQYDFYSMNAGSGNIVIPSWASYARITCGFSLPAATRDSRSYARVRINGNSLMSATSQVRNTEPALYHLDTGIVPVSAGQTIVVDIWHSYGGTITLDNTHTFINVELFEAV